ncbi:hypothetical protein MLD38_011708 [Melastoma candidum]|uniref:Uncharacterized protein n=1 Tax=Melastoma candidum TaxID=119954 RepID=A0ACB9R512_9MYRT|nr:hypothetical protein MLD38_011708 [Melastoma candidum]
MSEPVPGFRFYPTEEELISFYLYHHLRGQRDDIALVIPVVDVYRHEPWQLPGESGALCRGDVEQWFFFVPRQEREARGGRPTRITTAGYWKATGSPGYVYSSDNRVIGLKKTLVFYKGRSPNVQKTKWKMSEYRAIEGERHAAAESVAIPKVRYEWSLCRVYIVSGNFRAFDRRPQASIERSISCPRGDQGEHGDGSAGRRGTPDQPSTSANAALDWEQLMNN